VDVHPVFYTVYPYQWLSAGATLTITGAGFPSGSRAAVTVGGVAATIMNATSDGHVLQAKVPSLPTGTSEPVVVTADTIPSMARNVMYGGWQSPPPLDSSALYLNQSVVTVMQGQWQQTNLSMSGTWIATDGGANAAGNVVSTNLPFGSKVIPSAGAELNPGQGVLQINVFAPLSAPPGLYDAVVAVKDVASGVTETAVVPIVITSCVDSSPPTCVNSTSGTSFCGTLTGLCGETVQCACSGNTACSTANPGDIYGVCCPPGTYDSAGLCCATGTYNQGGFCCPGGTSMCAVTGKCMTDAACLASCPGTKPYCAALDMCASPLACKSATCPGGVCQ
jgi:hypothetical protein